MGTIKNLICFLFGHTLENTLHEDEVSISTEKCRRCGAVPLNKFHFKTKHIPPPNSTPEQVVQWEKYCETKYQRLRDSCPQN